MNSGIPGVAVGIPEEPHERDCAEPDRDARRISGRKTDQPRRQSGEPGQVMTLWKVPRQHRADIGRWEGLVQGHQDQAQHPQVRTHLSGRTSQLRTSQNQRLGGLLLCRKYRMLCIDNLLRGQNYGNNIL